MESTRSVRHSASASIATQRRRPSSSRVSVKSKPFSDNGRSDLSPEHIVSTGDRLVVGFDFGTTYSGVAAVYSAAPDDVDIIKTWPGGNGITSDKVPSEISYEAAGPRIPMRSSSISQSSARSIDSASIVSAINTEDYLKNVRWGFQIRPEAPRLRCIKLFLDRNQKLPPFVSASDIASALKRYDRNVLDAITDYLTMVYRHTMETLTRRYGESFMAQTPAEFVLTVPAVWSDSAKNATLMAAERSGMGSRHELRLISEPEAAAVYTIKTMQPAFLSEGDNFIVCDAGGGTVDLIAYRIVQLSPLKLEESAVGTGGLCGSALLNYRFEDRVKARIGEERFNHMREKKQKTWQMGLKHFEEFVKRNFSDEDMQEVNIPLPGLPDDEEAGLDCGFLVMTADEVRDIFTPIINQVIALVQGQVDALRRKGDIVSGIILVGGFGQSNYLYTQMKNHFAFVTPPASNGETNGNATLPKQSGQIEVMQPLNAWTAVVRGAVLRGLDGSIVSSRRTRCHYGTSYATLFDENKHPPADRYWSPLWERWMVSDRMQWHIAKGEEVSEGTAISFHYTRNFREGQSLIVEDELIACDDDYAPDAFADNLYSVCTMTTDLSAVPRHLFTRLTTSKGVEFNNLDFTLDMLIDSGGLGFELKVNGVRYGKVEAEFH